MDSNTDAAIREISRDSLGCIETIGGGAEQALLNYHTSDVTALAAVHTLNRPEQAARMGDVGRNTREQLSALASAPVIARVVYVDENDHERVIFVTRGTPTAFGQYKNIASYSSELGRLASFPPGAEREVTIRGESQTVEILTKAELFPHKENGVWDSLNSKIDLGAGNRSTVTSLRALLQELGLPSEDILSQLLGEEEGDTVRRGFRRATLTRVGLRDQPILDEFQDAIFRLPIGRQAFLSGPPGTGKTTTLVKRLGQKLDMAALDEQEGAAERRRILAPLVSHAPDFQNSWIMFSPTELLRLYVRDAFAREGVPAAESNIRTWYKFSRELARDVLGLLKSGTGRGSFVERETAAYLSAEAQGPGAKDWYEAFMAFFSKAVSEELLADATSLSKSKSADIAAIGKAIHNLLGRSSTRPLTDIAADIDELASGFGDVLQAARGSIERELNMSLNRLLHEDRSFLDQFGEAVSRFEQQMAADPEEDDDISGENLEDAFDDDDAAAAFAGRRLSRREAKARFDRLIRAAGAAASRGRRLGPKTLNGQLLDWLGEARTPERDVLRQIGVTVLEIGRIRKFNSYPETLLRQIARHYRMFRREMAQDGRWYREVPTRSSDIVWQELDLLILATLRLSSELVRVYQRGVVDLPSGGVFGGILGAYRTQVLVDEATDFSAIQLAAMHELSTPGVRSFFACGDFNQRLTLWGIDRSDDLDWIAPRIERRRITTSYRQTRRLVALARDIAELGGSDPGDVDLPDRADNEGVSPVWQHSLPTMDESAKWIAQRIREVEFAAGARPTVAVLVHDETAVEPMARALNTYLAEINISAVPCRDGEVMGDAGDVRVFNLIHIKGMEFEAVFFADLNAIIEAHPDLYTKFLYVGATRAATFLGATFSGAVPPEVLPLASHFGKDWA
jgi:hypothetical protein